MAKFCVKCGKEINEKDIICPNCGTKAAKIKPARDPKQVKALRKKAIVISSSLVILIAIITISIIAFINSTLAFSDIIPSLRGKTIMTVNGYKVPENEFRFFCALVLEDEDLVYYNKDNKDFDIVIKDEAKIFVKEYICRLSEAKEAGFKLTKEEEQKVLDDVEKAYKDYSKGTDIKSEKEFYSFFYGISKKQFIEFRKNWAIIDKYNVEQEKNADLSEQNQEKAYESYKDFLYAKKTMIVTRYLKDLDKDELKEEKELVEKLYNDIKNGDDMYAIVKGYGQDDTVIQSEGIISINSAYETSYPELYEWSETAEKGDLEIIETDEALYIVRCEDVVDFEKLKGTESMIEWTKFYTVNKNIEDLMKSDKYEVKLKEKNYNKLDISDLTKETLNYFNSVWQGQQ